MSHVYRFRIDLAALAGLGEQPPPRPEDDDDYTPSEVLDEMEGQRKREAAFAAALERLGPAERVSGPLPRSRAAGECLEAYNASLGRAQKARPGCYQESNIASHVFFDGFGNKHVVTRPLSQPDQRVSELILAPDGCVKRLSYERVFGPPDETQELFMNGLDEIDKQPQRFVRNPGYQLRLTDYQREGEELTAVVQEVYQFDPERRAIVQLEE